MIDAVVDGVVRQLGFGNRDGVSVLVGAAVGCVLAGEAVCQVDDFAHLSFLEQGGVAFAIYLLHLPAHGGQHQLVLAGDGVGRDFYAFARCLHRRLVAVATRMPVGGFALGAVGVQVVIDEP